MLTSLLNTVDDDAAPGRVAPLMERNAGPSTAVLCYICRSPDLPGKFDSQQAKKLGVPFGPLYGNPLRPLFLSLKCRFRNLTTMSVSDRSAV